MGLWMPTCFHNIPRPQSGCDPGYPIRVAQPCLETGGDGYMFLAGPIIIFPKTDLWTLGVRLLLSAGIPSWEYINLRLPAAILFTAWRNTMRKEAKLGPAEPRDWQSNGPLTALFEFLNQPWLESDLYLDFPSSRTNKASIYISESELLSDACIWSGD